MTNVNCAPVSPFPPCLTYHLQLFVSMYLRAEDFRERESESKGFLSPSLSVSLSYDNRERETPNEKLSLVSTKVLSSKQMDSHK